MNGKVNTDAEKSTDCHSASMVCHVSSQPKFYTRVSMHAHMHAHTNEPISDKCTHFISMKLTTVHPQSKCRLDEQAFVQTCNCKELVSGRNRMCIHTPWGPGLRNADLEGDLAAESPVTWEKSSQRRRWNPPHLFEMKETSQCVYIMSVKSVLNLNVLCLM